MNLRFTFCMILSVLGVFSSKTTAQCLTDFCTVPTPALAAPEACILSSEHDLDCYFGETFDNAPISLPPYWCTSVENNQWFAFMASSPSVELAISVGFCNNGGALQAALLETTDCVNFNFVSDCLGNIVSGTTQTLTNNVPLTPGNVYYLMLDGSAGAKCQFSINGSNSIIAGPSQVCIPGGTFTYYANSDVAWTIVPPNMGHIVGSNIGSSVEVNWLQPGIAQVCAEGVSCGNLPIYCISVSIGESAMVQHEHYLCAGGQVECGGQVYTSPGTYTAYAPSPTGCDSIITCVIIPVPPIIENLGQITLPCSGEYVACGEVFHDLGPHELTCTSWSGCDSTVIFNLIQGDVLADAGAAMALDCATPQVELDGSASSQGSGFSYQWATPDGHIVSGADTQSPLVDSVGNYCLTVTNLATGCVMIDCVEVTAAYNSLQIDIEAATAPCDGSTVQLSGSTDAAPGSSYAWTTTNGHIVNGETTLAPTIDSPGEYCLTVEDVNGCTASKCIQVEAKPAIELNGPTLFCPGEGNLGFEISTFTSAASVTVFYQVNNGPVGQTQQNGGLAVFDWNPMLDGTSSLQAWAVDGTGCPSDTVVLVVQENKAHVDFTVAQTVCNEAYLSASLNGSFQNTAVTFLWGNNVVDSAIMITQDGWYYVTITDNYGCETIDSVFATLDYSGFCAYLQGTVLNDLQQSCQLSPDDTPVQGFFVEAVNTSTNESFYGTTDVDGHYFIPVPPGDYVLTLLLPPGNGYAACGNAFPTPTIGIGSSYVKDFLIFQLPACPFMKVDVGVNLLRRCMNNAYYVFYCNQGSAVANNASIVLTLDPALSVLEITVPSISLGNNQYQVNLGDVLPGHCGSFQVLTFLDCGVPLGQVHCVQANIYPNTLCQGYGFNLFMDEDCHPNIGSYDPNAKTASPAGEGAEHLIAAGSELTYQIRFQNTGTDTAYNVVVRDTLADMLDLASLQPGVSSHPYSFEIYGQRILKFTFNGVKLPPIGTNEPGSIGFFQFKIRLKDDLAPQTLVENQATVYFDYNYPVSTNKYFHTISSPSTETFQSADICQGESYLFNGEALTLSGIYIANLVSSQGADSTVHLNLTVHPKVITELSAQICEGESVVFNGETLTQTGDYKVTLQTSFGCDSIVNFSLDVWPQYETLETATICTGTTYPFNGEDLDQPGEYQAHLSSTHGCDSTVILMLEVVNAFQTSLQANICDGETYWFQGEQLAQGGIYTADLTSVGGCDSIVTLDLAVLPPAIGTEVLTVCEGESILIDGQEVSGGDTLVYVIAGGSSHGCDSTVVLAVQELPTSGSAVEQSICEGETFPFNGQTLTTAGVYEAVLPNSLGCDSTVTLTLSVLPNSPVTNISLEVLQGTVYNGTTIEADTVLTEHLVNMNGCDSTIVTSITVLPNSTSSLLEQWRFELQPNPANGAVQVHFHLPNATLGSLHLLDVVGREMPQPNAVATNFAAGDHSLLMDVAALPSGMYLVQFRTELGTLAAKLVVE